MSFEVLLFLAINADVSFTITSKIQWAKLAHNLLSHSRRGSLGVTQRILPNKMRVENIMYTAGHAWTEKKHTFMEFKLCSCGLEGFPSNTGL